MKFLRSFSAAVSLLLVFSVLFTCFAADSSLSDSQGKVLSVAHCGDRFNYPVGSAQNITSCVDFGVDMISLPVVRSSDGTIIVLSSNELSLCCADESGNPINGLANEHTAKEITASFLFNTDFTLSNYHPITLTEAFTAAGETLLILDAAWEYRDDIATLAEEAEKTDSVVLRTNASAKDIISFAENYDNHLQIIGIYSGNIVFAATRKADSLLENGMHCVQFSSGNFFASIYDTLAMRRFRKGNKGRALVSTYDKNLCGQREDSREGWDDLIARGYSVIETENPKLLAEYLDDMDASRLSLTELCDSAENIDRTVFSPVSSSALKQALDEAQATASNSSSSLAELDASLAHLHEAIDSLVPGHSKDTQRNNFNVTPGKIIAVILGGAAVVAAQIFVHKRQKPRKKA